MGHALEFLVQGVPKYQHVERLGHEDVEGLLDEEVYVQEKIDGANLTVAWSHVLDKQVIGSRNNAISIGETPNAGFNGAIEYVLGHHGITRAIIEHKMILRGEWLVRHAMNYDAAKMGQFYVFDVQRVVGDKEGELVVEYIDPIDYIPILESLSIPYIRTQARGIFSVSDLAELSQAPSDYSTIPLVREGIVVKRVNFVNRYGRTTWGKIVTADFQEKKHLHTHSMKHDPSEMRFAALSVTRALVLKEIAKVADREGRASNIRDMGEVLGRVWHSVFTEELWDFVKKYRVQGFHFGNAQRCVILKARDIALAHYNGLPEGFNVEKNQGGGNSDVPVREEASPGSVPVGRESDMPAPTAGENPKWWSVKAASEAVDPA